MADTSLGPFLRGQFEAGRQYPTTFPGVLDAYGGSTRALALELDAAEGRADRHPRTTQRSFQRYLRGERRPDERRMERLRGLARGRLARQWLTPFRARGIGVVFIGKIRISQSVRVVRFSLALSPQEVPDTLDAVERGMLTGNWSRADSAFRREVIEEAYGQGWIDLAEVQEIEAFSIRPL